MNKFNCLLTIGVLIVGTEANAQAQGSMCEQILGHGIYDSRRILDDYSRFELAKEVHCGASANAKAQNIAMGYEAFSFSRGGQESASSSFCDITENEERVRSIYREAVDSINEGVIQAWSGCVSTMSTGMSHSVTPVDEMRFSYRILYKPDGEPYTVTGVKWSVESATCTPMIETTDVIDNGGITISCTRSGINETVSLVINSAPSGIANINTTIALPSLVRDESGTGPGRREYRDPCCEGLRVYLTKNHPNTHYGNLSDDVDDLIRPLNPESIFPDTVIDPDGTRCTVTYSANRDRDAAEWLAEQLTTLNLANSPNANFRPRRTNSEIYYQNDQGTVRLTFDLRVHICPGL